jgi:glycosyltransferase involved in cell wall biosynthesis
MVAQVVMTRSALISRYLPSDPDMVHGIYQRLGLLVDAMCRVSSTVECLFVVPRGTDASPARVLELQTKLQQRWSPKVRLRIAPTLEYPEHGLSRYERYVKAVLSSDGVEDVVPYLNDASKRAVSELLDTRPDFVVAHRTQTMALLSRLPAAQRSMPIFFDMDDVEHVALARRLISNPKWPMERVRLTQIPAMMLCERRAVKAATRTFVCSESDQKYLGRLFGTRNVEVLPNTVAIPEQLPASDGKPTVLFVGTFGYPPNISAAALLLSQIWPAIHAQVPEAQLVLVGKKPENIPGYATNLPGVEFAGFVPELAPYYARARLVCCPILSGSGTRIKILEAASYGKAVVSTTIGAEGIELDDGTEFIRADSVEALVAASVRLLRDETEAKRLGNAAREKMRARYSRESAVKLLSTMMLDCLPDSSPLAAVPGGGAP